jgi:hypothetical protein
MMMPHIQVAVVREAAVANPIVACSGDRDEFFDQISRVLYLRNTPSLFPSSRASGFFHFAEPRLFRHYHTGCVFLFFILFLDHSLGHF